MAEIHIKFVPQQPVWVMCDNRPIEAVIEAVKISIEHHSLPAKIEYKVSLANGNGATYREDFVFATKEELKKSIFG